MLKLVKNKPKLNIIYGFILYNFMIIVYGNYNVIDFDKC